jgi:hypothetical protein
MYLITMNLRLQKSMCAVVFCLCYSLNVICSQELRTNYFAAVNHEVDLARSLFVETNRAFDEKICAVLNLESAKSVEVQFLQVTFVFFYPRTNDVGPSFSEMGILHRLVGKPNNMLRSDSATNEIPLNYIRVFDPAKSEVTAELRVFVMVSPVDQPSSRRFLNKSFEFVYNRGWKPKALNGK